MARKPSFDYFDAFIRIARYAREEAVRLQRIFDDFDVEAIHEELHEMHALENAADLVNHEVYTHLVDEFITPIERDDIISLTQELDECVDAVEDILQRIYMFNVREIIPQAKQMMALIAKSTESLLIALQDFPNFKKSNNIREHLIQVNTHEEEADRLYIDTLHEIYSTWDDPVAIITWTKVFDRMERCADSCEHAADVVGTVIMKNS
ncbi:MAG: DUF47 family protein [Coriobacteriales bacterium]|nr:DUF47 family protein [Coriobacteriales bacterium]